MCGINGLSGNHEEAINQMNQALLHRGPDFAGRYVDDQISLGHTLLSIRSSESSSHQPFTKPHSPWILLFNGQLYNTLNIKRELGPNVTNTDLDTALLFELIEKYGWNFINYIHGMYAIALYNRDQGEIKLYRDPTGQKNIYYFNEAGQFAFSSELKSLISQLKNKKVNEEAIGISASIGYLPGHLTIVDSVFKVLPSQVIGYNLKTKTLTRDFFKSEAPNYFPDDFSQAMSKLIEEHLQSKPLVTINLSGGLDSSLLLYEMTKLGYKTQSYSNYFTLPGEDLAAQKKYNTDAILAARLAADLGTTHHQIEVGPQDYLNNLETAYGAVEEPDYNISLPTYYQMAKVEGINGAGHRVVFSGDGGDEIFGGYPHYFEAQKIAAKMKKYGPVLYGLIRRLRDGTNVKWCDPAEVWFSLKQLEAYLTRQLPPKLVANYASNSSHYFLDRYAQKNSPAYNLMLIDRILWMASENFIRSDKLYMKESMEMRCPLAYHPFRLYIDQKIKNEDYINEDGNKIFLRNHYQNKLPDYIVNRADKTGWRAPVSVWYDNQFKEAFLGLVGNRPNDIIDWSKVRQLIKESEAWPGKEIHYYLSLSSILKNLGF